MNKRIISLTLALMLVLGLFAGCGSKPATNEPVATTPVVDATQPAGPKYEEVDLADAIEQVRDYPTVSVAWAAYMGLAIANGWDTDWAHTSSLSYKELYGSRGFDDMDEHIVQNILGFSLDSTEAKQIMNILLCCAQKATTFIQHEQIEHQTVKAFHIFARTVKVMFRTGAALELKRLGYKFQKIDLDRVSKNRLS